MEGGKRGYRFIATGTSERLLAGVKVVNEFGGGQVILPLLASFLRFEIQGVVLAARIFDQRFRKALSRPYSSPLRLTQAHSSQGLLKWTSPDSVDTVG
jgi:hypothetical protein